LEIRQFRVEKQGHICVLGECNIDAWFLTQKLPKWFSVTPSDSARLVAGGKGLNAALATARLGGKAILLSVIGEDIWGRTLKEVIKDLTSDIRQDDAAGEVNTDYILTVPGPTSVCGVLTNHRIDGPAYLGTRNLKHWTGVHSFAPEWRDVLEKAQVLITSLEPPMHLVREAIQVAKNAGAIIVMNPGPQPRSAVEYQDLLDVLHDVDVLVPNRSEARDIVARRKGTHSSDSGAELAEILQDLINTSRFGLVCVTRSRVGYDAVYCEVSPSDNSRFVRQRAKGSMIPVTTDPLGGGDAFCSAIAVELARGTPVEGALQVGRAAAAVAVTTPGAAAAMPHREAVAAVLRREA